MNFYLQLSENSAQCIDWSKIAASSAQGVFTLIGIVIAALLTYRFALRQKYKEALLGFEQLVFDKKLKALKDCWALLAYITTVENPKSVLRWEKKSNGDISWFARTENANNFLKELPKVFYGEGHGVYLSKNIKELLFEYRGILCGLLLNSQKQEITGDTKEFYIKNNKMIKRMQEIYDDLNKLIKAESLNVEQIGLKK